MTRKEAIKLLRKLRETIDRNNAYGEAEEMGIQALEQEPCDDAISRQAVLDLLEDTNNGWIINEVSQLPSVKPQESYDFAKWVATEIFDEWEYNKDAFAEIACRKLAKLGIVRAKCDEWELIESKESDHKCHTCKHYTSGERDGSCGSYICKGYSDWESEDKE